MKAMLTLILVACLVASALPVTAQAQQATPGPLARATAREAGRLAAAAQIGRSDDWDAVRRLKDGTRVLVTTRQDRRLSGKLTTVSEDALQMGVRWGRKQTLRRDDIREVRLGHRLSVAQYGGLGLLLGGVTGWLGGSRTHNCYNCDPPIPATVAYGAFGSFVGSAVGFAIGSAVNARSGRLVYARAKP